MFYPAPEQLSTAGCLKVLAALQTFGSPFGVSLIAGLSNPTHLLSLWQVHNRGKAGLIGKGSSNSTILSGSHAGGAEKFPRFLPPLRAWPVGIFRPQLKLRANFHWSLQDEKTIPCASWWKAFSAITATVLFDLLSATSGKAGGLR